MKDDRIAEQSLLIESVDGCEIKIDVCLNTAATKYISASEVISMLKEFFSKEFGRQTSTKVVQKAAEKKNQKPTIKTREDYVDSKFDVFYEDIRVYEQ